MDWSEKKSECIMICVASSSNIWPSLMLWVLSTLCFISFFACSLDTYTWTKMPSLGRSPSPRYFHSCVMHENKVRIFVVLYDDSASVNVVAL